MSSSLTKSSTIMNDNIDKDKTNIINTFSRNFTRCYNGIKFPHSKNNENNIIITNNNNTISIKNYKDSKLDKLDPLAEYEFVYDDSQNMDLNKKEEVKLNKVVIHNQNNNKLIFQPNSSNKNFASSKLSFNKKSNCISSPNQKLSRIQTFLNKNKNNHIKKKSKKNQYEKANFNSFLDNLKYYQDKREKNMNNLRNKSLEKENSQIRNKPKISKNSDLLMKHIKREPLYQKRPFNEKKNLDKKFENFYSKNYDSNSSSAILKSPKMNDKKIEEKFSKFYEDNIKWKKNLEEINNHIRNNNIKKYEDKIGVYTFRPTLDKNSIYIVDKLNRNRTIEYDINNIYEYENQKELLDKLKTRLKPMLNNIRNLSIGRPYINKKSSLMKRTLSDIYISKRNNNYNNLSKTTRNKECRINFKEKEKKDKSKNYKEKNEEKSINKKSNKKKKESDLLDKINKLKNEKENKQKELYKINVRQGTAWNQEVINNIIPRKKCGYIIEGLL